MANRTYGLLVGINDYAPSVGKLAGCLNDVDHFHDYLQQHVDKASLAIEVLKDADATRANVIDRFRVHLGQAKAGDVAVFHYCGHGARWASNTAFRAFYPDGKDEGLVCFDSRQAGGYDLADKELAVLISEIARNDVELAVLLDCCHSGSGTRGVDAFRGLTPRQTHEVTTERPLESYLDGYYTRNALFIPTARHMLLAACERGQLAQESPDHSGVFTSTIVEVLTKSRGDLSYADLFVRCRAAVRTRAYDQNPQFEACGDFDANTGFLGRSVARGMRRYAAYFGDQGAWNVECGAIHGVPTEPETTVRLALYREDEATKPVGTATAVQVGAQKSELTLDFESDKSVRYRAEITTLPAAPTPIAFSGADAARSVIETALRKLGVSVILIGVQNGAGYTLKGEAGCLILSQAGCNKVIGYVELAGRTLAEAAASLAPALKHVIQWERVLRLQNLRTKLDPSQVEFVFAEQLEGGGEHAYLGGDVILDYARVGGDWRQIRGRMRVRNGAAQTLHVVLAYFSEAFGISIFRNEPIAPGDAWVTLWGDQPDDYFYLDEGANESIERFMLLVTTEKADDFLLAQDALELGKSLGAARAIGTVKPQRKLVYENEWFTKQYRLRVVRRLDEVAASDARIAGGQIVVRGHPAVTANISLGAATSASRGVRTASDFYKAFEQRGMALLNFAGTRGDPLNVLELSDIQNASALRDHPLEIELNVPLDENEGILPLVHDGQHVFLGGAPDRQPDGITRITIDHIPEVADQRRSIGGALKLYFLKTYLKNNDVNQLRWLAFKPDGTPVHQKTGVADKVASARNVLLLVHGIIGDTEDMARGVKACGLDQKFDLILTYDYESLSTSIGDTAKDLKAILGAAGLHDGDDKRLTLLVHSMGGLVSRWFIEREGGNRMVDHLVMCGTPNNGSPFGRIDDARHILSTLTVLAMNYIPALIPFSSAVLFLLNRSKKLTPALEQMNPNSEFIRTLNQSGDPGIPYTVLAGDVDSYHEPGDPLFARMLAKAAQSAPLELLFANKANDIAVGVDSILGVGADRAQHPVQKNVACHHLNYFASQAGHQALAW
jgi:pimeloyl-ACP methyl ester carboxylesterase